MENSRLIDLFHSAKASPFLGAEAWWKIMTSRLLVGAKVDARNAHEDQDSKIAGVYKYSVVIQFVVYMHGKAFGRHSKHVWEGSYCCIKANLTSSSPLRLIKIWNISLQVEARSLP